MPAALAAVLVPTLFWTQPAGTADALRKADIERLCVPAGLEPAWRKLGFTVTAFRPGHATEATAPKVEYHMDVASATRVPWVDANGWRFERNPAGSYFYKAPAGGAELAAAEAFAYGVEATVQAAPDDLPGFGRMLRFLAEIAQPPLPAMANIGVVDDGSDTMGEVLNLMSRHNLLFRIVPAADPKYDLNVRNTADAADPYQFAMSVRRRLTDEKRLLRIYGSNVVLGRLTGDGTRARLHLLNYGNAAVAGLRVRVRGSYQQGKLAVFDHPHAALQDFAAADGAAEFTIPEMGTYAVVDLTSGK
ncbi:MAG: hypothetical protein ABSH50_27120 [Bryobacteraceae bacterium]|jgi:hypothetical protein